MGDLKVTPEALRSERMQSFSADVLKVRRAIDDTLCTSGHADDPLLLVGAVIDALANIATQADVPTDELVKLVEGRMLVYGRGLGVA